MKKFFTILMAFAVLSFTQCKKQPVDNPDTETEVRKVRVSCVIPINKGVRSDFSNLIENGSVNWSEGWERVYVAIHGATPTIIELKSWADGNPSKLEFEGEAAKDLITDGTEYDIWYFGHSQQLDEPFVELIGNTLTGSIANQSGRLEDLGYCHIAKTTVTAETVNEEVILNLNGTLEHQIAIALLDLNNVTELFGDAIKGTEYTLTYNSGIGKYELLVTEDSNARISVESAAGISYVVLLPNEEKETMIKNKQDDKTYSYTFHNGIKANKIYCKIASDGTTVEALAWEEYDPYNGYEYVDLGLPSGLKWATCNVGAETPEAYGNYYAWGETETKSVYTDENSVTSGEPMFDFSGNAQYDAATANWGGSWRMPTKEQMEELVEYCEWEWTQVNGVNGAKVIGPNGSCIFLPAAGYRTGSFRYYGGYNGYYWSSTQYVSGALSFECAYSLYFDNGGEDVDRDYNRYYGFTVRPITE